MKKTVKTFDVVPLSSDETQQKQDANKAPYSTLEIIVLCVILIITAVGTSLIP